MKEMRYKKMSREVNAPSRSEQLSLETSGFPISVRIDPKLPGAPLTPDHKTTPPPPPDSPSGPLPPQSFSIKDEKDHKDHKQESHSEDLKVSVDQDAKHGPISPALQMKKVLYSELKIVGLIESKGDNTFSHEIKVVEYQGERYILKICENTYEAYTEYFVALWNNLLAPEMQPSALLVEDAKAEITIKARHKPAFTKRGSIHIISKEIKGLVVVSKQLAKERRLVRETKKAASSSNDVSQQIANMRKNFVKHKMKIGKIKGLGLAIASAQTDKNNDARLNNLGTAPDEQPADLKSEPTHSFRTFDNGQCLRLDLFSRNVEGKIQGFKLTKFDVIAAPYVVNLKPYNYFGYVNGEVTEEKDGELLSRELRTDQTFRHDYHSMLIRKILFKVIAKTFIETCFGSTPHRMDHLPTDVETLQEHFQILTTQSAEEAEVAMLGAVPTHEFLETKIYEVADLMLDRFTLFTSPDGISFIDRCPENIRELLYQECDRIQARLRRHSVSAYECVEDEKEQKTCAQICAEGLAPCLPSKKTWGVILGLLGLTTLVYYICTKAIGPSAYITTGSDNNVSFGLSLAFILPPLCCLSYSINCCLIISRQDRERDARAALPSIFNFNRVQSPADNPAPSAPIDIEMGRTPTINPSVDSGTGLATLNLDLKNG